MVKELSVIRPDGAGGRDPQPRRRKRKARKEKKKGSGSRVQNLQVEREDTPPFPPTMHPSIHPPVFLRQRHTLTFKVQEKVRIVLYFPC